MSKTKPVGWKPDGTHIHKGALALIICSVIGAYCMISDAPFGTPKDNPVKEVVQPKVTGDK